MSTKAFTGHERDAETGLDYMMARYYGSSLGRFQSPDPGVDVQPEDPQSWNMYTYVRNNPILLTDPDGRKVKIDKGPDGFKNKMKRMINKLRKKDKAFNKAWKQLKKDKVLHTIKPHDSEHQKNETQVNDEGAAEDGMGTGTTTWFDPDHADHEGRPIPAEWNLSHEASHMEDAATGTRDQSIDPVSGIKRNEIKGVRFENRTRRAWGPGETQRTTYEGRDVPDPFAEPPNPWPQEN